MEFLLTDPTNHEVYSRCSFNCVDFSDMLHNNAEVAGIKSAFISSRFEDEPLGHTLNAFRTTDKGLVYVDSSGRVWDQIAYVVQGKELGFVSIVTATSHEYSYCEKTGKGLSDT